MDLKTSLLQFSICMRSEKTPKEKLKTNTKSQKNNNNHSEGSFMRHPSHL